MTNGDRCVQPPPPPAPPPDRDHGTDQRGRGPAPRRPSLSAAEIDAIAEAVCAKILERIRRQIRRTDWDDGY